jgi:hypothetical protein
VRQPAWSPILESRERQHALELVADIAAELEPRYPAGLDDSEAWTLAGGRSGVALLFAYLGQALEDDRAQLTAVRLVEESREAAVGNSASAGPYEASSASPGRWRISTDRSWTRARWIITRPSTPRF